MNAFIKKKNLYCTQYNKVLLPKSAYSIWEFFIIYT